MNRVLYVLVVLFGITAAEAAHAADSCVSEEAKQKLSACPNTGPTSFNVGAHGKTPTVGFHAVKPDDKKLKENKPNAPSEQMSAASRDDRASRLQQRALELLVREISGLEQLYKGLRDPRDKDRIKYLRRLAEDWVELENAAWKQKTEAEVKRDELKSKNPAEAGKQQSVVNARNNTMLVARRAAIKYYETIAQEYNGSASTVFAQNPPPAYAQLDQIYYYLAYEYEQSSDLTNARRVYLDLIQNTPTSPYVPNAYLAFGELFFNEAQGDPSKWAPAKQAYEEVVKKPPPDNKVYGYAWYKIAYVFWNTGDFPHSLQAFKKVIDYGTTYAQLPNAAKLADSARRDIIPVYAQSGSASDAYNFFKNLSGDAQGSNAKTFKMMDDLGLNYIDTGHYPDAITLYKDLLVRDTNGDKTCAYQSHISEATMAMKGGDKATIVKELDNQLKRYNAFKAENHSEDAKKECANKTAAMMTETAMAWHLEAVGSNGQRGTGDPRTMDAASQLYGKVAQTWTQDQYKDFTFKLVKEDWPTIYKIKYNMADLIYFRAQSTADPEKAKAQWGACGPAFDAVVEENPNGPDAAEAAYAAVLCYQQVYLLEHKPGSDRVGKGNLPGSGKDIKKETDEKYKAKDTSTGQKGMINSFQRYVCYIKPDKSDADGQKQLVEVKYFRARTFFELQRWEEAALAFKDVAFNHPDSDLAVPAAQLYLESINVLTWHGNPNRPACLDDMIADVPKFIDSFCSNGKDAKNADVCTTLIKVQCDIQRLRAQRIVEDADKGPTNALQLYSQAGEAYFKLWETYGAEPLKANKPAQCENLQEIVYNAARAFQAGRLIASAIRARKVLLDPQYRMETTELAKDAMFEIGGNFQAIAVYDQAAEWYERYANKYKDRKKADEGLSDAIVLRLGLGQEDLAIADAKTFQANYGHKNPIKAAGIAFAVGAHYAEQEKWDDCRKALQGSMGVVDKSPPDIQLQAHATLARCLDRMKAYPGSRAEYRKVLAIWGNGSDAVGKINAAYSTDDEGQKARKLGKALDAVGEAIFVAAEDKKTKDVDPIKFPVYTGIGTKDDVLNHIQKKVVPWFKKKKEAIEVVEKEYARVITDLKPVPPPRWVIAAASRAGMMWGDFVTEFRKAPIPKEWNKYNDVRLTYFQKLDEASEPYKLQAKGALKKCLDQSVEFQYFDDYSRNCEKWLSENYKTEYHIIDELRGAPTLSNGGLDDRPPPLIIGARLWHAAATGPATEKAGTTAPDEKKDDKPKAEKPAKKGGRR
jgi:TolA-binding protein